MGPKQKVSLIVPCYNSGSYIYRNLQEVVRTLHKFGIDHEIIVVDDGSTDNTFEEAKEAENGNLKVVGYTENKGKGYALKYGVRFATGDFITFADADLDIHPNQLMTLIRYMEENNADIVIGSKRHKDSKVDYPLKRRILSYVYHLFVAALFRLKIKDTQGGFKLLKRQCADKILPKVLIKKFAFDLELLVVAKKFGFKIVEAPIEVKQLFKSSSVGAGTIKNMLQDTLAVAYRLYLLKWYDEDHIIPKVLEKK